MSILPYIFLPPPSSCYDPGLVQVPRIFSSGLIVSCRGAVSADAMIDYGDRYEC